MAVRIRRFWRFLSRNKSNYWNQQQRDIYQLFKMFGGHLQTNLCSLKTELSKTIFSRSSISSLGRSAVMKALTVTDTSSGSWVSESAVCTTCEGRENNKNDLNLNINNTVNCNHWEVVYLVYQWPSVGVALQENTGPQIRVLTTHQIPRQTLEEGVFIAHLWTRHAF